MLDARFIAPGPLIDLPYDIFVLSDRAAYRQGCMDQQSTSVRWDQLIASIGLKGHIAHSQYENPAMVVTTLPVE